MNIDRPMVSLFFEIKRNMPQDKRDEMKISAPDIGKRLISIYRKTNNQSLKQLIETFMTRAGADWAKQLEKNKKKQKLMFYRGAAVD